MPVQKENMTMFDMVNKISNILGEVAENEGVITDEQIKALDIFKGDFKEKAQAICHVRRHIESDVDYWRGVKAAADAKIKALNNRKDRLENYLMNSMKLINVEKISGDRYMFSISITKGRDAVCVKDIDMLPEGFYKKQPDKTKIKKALDAGESVVGASLEKGNDYLTIRASTKFTEADVPEY